MFKQLCRLFALTSLLTFSIVATATFDPTTEIKLITPDGATNNGFGKSVAIDGTRMAVGAVFDKDSPQGAVYIYNFDGTSWVPEAKLTPADDEYSDNFGTSVSLNGNRLAVGADRDDVNNISDQGSVYVFEINDGAWVETAKLTASDGAADNRFGISVSLDNDYLAVGSLKGVAYVFDLKDGNWHETKLPTPDDEQGSLFGPSVSLDNGRLAVGDRGVRGIAHSYPGSVYIFDLNDNVWTRTQKLTLSEDYHGSPVYLDGDRLAVGIAAAIVDNNSNQGSVYIFDLDAGTWSETQKLTASDGESFDAFGWSVSLDGNRLAVGAPGKNVVDNINQGWAYVFELNNDGWNETVKLAASDGGQRNQFGESVSLDNNHLAIGAMGGFVLGDQASTYVYTSTTLSTVTGAWYDENYNGMGFNMVETDSGLFAYFYGYKGGINGQAQWLLSEAPIAMPIEKGTPYTVNMVSGFVGNGGSFTSKPTTGSGVQTWGTMTLTFNDCGSAVATLDGADGQLYQDLSRIVEVSGLSCVESTSSQQAAQAPTKATTGSTFTGAWYDEDYNGMGFNMVETGSGLFTYFYGYKGGTDGEAQWLLSEESIPTPVEKGTSYTVDMASGFVGNGGTFTTKPTSGSSGLQHWGIMTLMFETCDTAIATLIGQDGQVTHEISRIAAIPGLDCVE